VHGYYDWRRWAIAAALCTTGDSVIEIGSNIGTETVGFADFLGPSGRVYAFEPLPSNLAILIENARNVRYRNVSVFPCEIGDRSGSVRFAPPDMRQHSGIGRVLWQADQTNTIEVQCCTLDSLMEKLPRIRALFVDAEGAELRILRGAEGLIKRDAPVIIIEASEVTLKSAGSSTEELATKILDADYDLFEIRRFGLARLKNPKSAQSEGNWFCVPRDQASVSTKVSDSILACALLPTVARLNPLRLAHWHKGESRGRLPANL